MRNAAILLLSVALLAAGCTKSESPKAKPTQSTAQTMIEGVTGRTAVNAGQKAKADITRISEQRNRDLEAAME